MRTCVRTLKVQQGKAFSHFQVPETWCMCLHFSKQYSTLAPPSMCTKLKSPTDVYSWSPQFPDCILKSISKQPAHHRPQAASEASVQPQWRNLTHKAAFTMLLCIGAQPEELVRPAL
jgi:hypothetical protein